MTHHDDGAPKRSTMFVGTVEWGADSEIDDVQAVTGALESAGYDTRMASDNSHLLVMRERPAPGDLQDDLQTAAATANLVKRVTIGTGIFDPAYPFHGALRECPFCGDVYRRHGGFADHRDRCEAGPVPGANPVGPPEEEGSP
jgi:hypothetical protein